MSYLYNLLFTHFHGHQLYNVIKKDALVLCTFLEYPLLFLNDNVNEGTEKFSNSESSAWECCLAFANCQFQPGVAYLSVAYKKVCID